MLNLVFGAAVAGLAALAAAQTARRLRDEREADAAWALLAGSGPQREERFDPALVARLPEPARRFFRWVITPGAPLLARAEITMRGELSLGTKAAPRYQPMRARQVLAAPHGMVWRAEMGAGAMRVSGSDGMAAGRSWTRFWLLGLVPVARAGGDPDHLRSAFGRVVAEAAFWSPAALLPQPHVTWSAVDADTARVTVERQGLRQSADIRVDAAGRPLWVSMPRWTNANAKRQFREQPFGGFVADFHEVQGYRLPFRVDGGNFFGTDAYFPFYRAEVLAITLR